MDAKQQHPPSPSPSAEGCCLLMDQAKPKQNQMNLIAVLRIPLLSMDSHAQEILLRDHFSINLLSTAVKETVLGFPT